MFNKNDSLVFGFFSFWGFRKKKREDIRERKAVQRLFSL